MKPYGNHVTKIVNNIFKIFIISSHFKEWIAKQLIPPNISFAKVCFAKILKRYTNMLSTVLGIMGI